MKIRSYTDGAQRITIHIPVSINAETVAWVARQLGVSPATALAQIREGITAECRDELFWQTWAINTDGDKVLTRVSIDDRDTYQETHAVYSGTLTEP